MLRLTTPSPTEGDRIHQRNCFYYLTELSVAIPHEMRSRPAWQTIARGWDERVSYADLYHHEMKWIEDNLATVQNYFGFSETGYARFIHMVFANPNENLIRVGNLLIQQHQDPESMGSSDVSQILQQGSIQARGPDKDSLSPAMQGSTWGRLRATFDFSNYRPTLTTSLPTVRNYHYNSGKLPQEIRMGTQAQFVDLHPRISPLFESFIATQDTNQAHLYINNLGRDRGVLDPEGLREKAFTQQLEELENKYPGKIYVVTLPADKGIFDHHALEDDSKSLSLGEVGSIILNIAQGQDQKMKIPRDFYVSAAVKEKLFKPGEEEKILQQMINRSFEAMGYNPNNQDQMLSEAELQAVYFHFIKYEYTKLLIDTLKPTTFNISCKDAIDRGAVASLYYNLLRSLETDQPLSQEEFIRGLHAAAAMVKGRGVNRHQDLLWNSIDHYVAAHQSQLQTKGMEWLIEWRNSHVPAGKQSSPPTSPDASPVSSPRSSRSFKDRLLHLESESGARENQSSFSSKY